MHYPPGVAVLQRFENAASDLPDLVLRTEAAAGVQTLEEFPAAEVFQHHVNVQFILVYFEELEDARMGHLPEDSDLAFQRSEDVRMWQHS